MQVVCTATMALGSRLLAAQRAIVARLSSIEQLAGMTVLCSDKTGTLTLNKMVLQETLSYDDSVEGPAVLTYAALATRWNEPPKDAIDTLVLKAPSLDRASLDRHTQLEFTPSADELYASVREAGDDLGPVTCWKFGDDTIDCSDALADALAAGGASTTVPLAGTHLTPVFFKLSATDVDPRLGALLGDVTYTLGDDAAIEALVDALAEWVWPMSKKPPTARVLEASS